MARASYPGAPAGSDEAKHRAEGDVRTLIRAGEIRRDKERLRAALKCAREQMKSLEAVEG